ncbi:hypothetical protein D7Z54_32385 [Salibacterium salarium]|uniref:Uncharacterized protein n=1 Tax=Salibacterium salarium TaxID=284579 RepID=A0A3R9NZ01_9BACI|nr:hypothetical protein [Salibacterium salarium]RSL29237.1 hypothetical protein D7Z54_32385 [Salibacterium salarium]
MPANKEGVGINDSRTPTARLLDAFRGDLTDLDARLAERERKTSELYEERRQMRQAVAELERAVAEEKARQASAAVAAQVRRSYE